MLLAIDTSTRYAGIALMDKEGMLRQLLHWRSQQNHTVELIPSIQQVFARQGVTLADLDGIAIAIGPGSFSALRVGLSVAKGLAWTSNVPLAAVTTLEAEAFPFRGVAETVCAILDAGRGELALGIYTSTADGVTLVQPEAIVALHRIKEAIPPATLLCGEGLERLTPEVAASLAGHCRLALPYHSSQRVVALAHVGRKRLQAGQAQDPVTLQPFYLRKPSITEPAQPSTR
ncbi:MAG: tRNA (adenosine(37)-N6)-threonylcarbamoyltransferase complex dimerization subunit type 1 TsaB [Chloroflexi bacterium]|nr:tRNA (adenosine(37)-N6)-threonylcarbamoyltransferase complex dimerization subunit type 1 TsaB [Chloroflexota bacterium]